MADYQEGLADYMKSVGERPVPTREEERRMFERLESGDESAREDIIRSNMRFVIRLARQFTGRGLPLEDLIQEGNIGLIEVIDKFDYHRGFRFTTYAAFWIRQSIQQALRKQSNLIRLPTRKLRMLGAVTEKVRGFNAEHGREPTVEELAGMLDVSVKTTRDLLRMRESVVSIDESWGEGPTLGESLPAPRGNPAVERITEGERKDKVGGVLQFLNEKERRVLRLRFGFDLGKALSLRRTSKLVGLSQEGVRRVEKKALAKLRRPSILARVVGLL